MDELQSYQRERPRPSEEKREKKRSGRRDYLVRVIAVQLAVCAVLLTGAFLMVKTNPNAQKALREAYEGILSQDWSAQEAAAAFKEIGAFIFAPADSWPDADDPTQAAQANAAAGASETMGAASAQGKEPSTESPSQRMKPFLRRRLMGWAARMNLFLTESEPRSRVPPLPLIS